MAKLSLTDISSGYALTTTINDNNALVEAAVENSISRDGTAPNTMGADLDMNSNQITNLPTPTATSHATNKAYVDAQVVSASSGDMLASNNLSDVDSAVTSLVNLGLTATAAEINLLDLSGLTAGDVLSADTASTASWKAAAGGSGIDNVVEDLTPQLGGNLDVNGQTITSAAAGNITIEPNGAGVLNLNSGSGGVSIVTNAGNSDITLDPHGTGNVLLGGNLDLNSNDITGTGNITYTGVITGTGAAKLGDTGFGDVEVHRNSATQASSIKYTNTDGVKGYMGFNDTGVLQIYDASLVLNPFYVDSAGIVNASAFVSDSYTSNSNALVLNAGSDRVSLDVAGSRVADFAPTLIVFEPPVYMLERAAAGTDFATFGQLWCKNAVPNELWFTNDAGTDYQLGDNIAVSALADGTDGELITWSAAGAPTTVAVGTATDVLTSNGAGAAPTFQAPAVAASAITAGNLASTVDPYVLGSNTSSSFCVVFADSTSGTSANSALLKDSGAALTYNPLINTLTSGAFSGTLNASSVTGCTIQDYGLTSNTRTVSANAVACDLSTGNAFEVDLEAATGTVTITLSNPPDSGTYGECILKVQQDTTAARAITWAGGTFKWPGGAAPTMSTAADAIDIFTFKTWDAGTTWYGDVSQAYA